MHVDLPTRLTLSLGAIVCALALFMAPASAQVAFPPDSTVQVLIQELVENRGIRAIVLGLLDEDGNRRVIAHGDPGPDALPLNGDSVFEIGSMTKVGWTQRRMTGQLQE